jgi:hypothetical protein
MEKLLRPILSVEKKYLLLSLILLPIIFWVSSSGRQGPFIEHYDYWEHAACINELSINPLDPRDPFLHVEGIRTLRYTPYIFLLGVLGKLSHLSHFTVIRLSSIISFLILIAGVYLWSKEYFQDKELPFYVLVAFLFLWGEPFNYSYEYNLRFLSYTLFYPSIATLNLSFFGLYFILRYVRSGKGSYYLLYLLLASFVFVSHPLTGSFFLMCSFLLIVTEGQNILRNLALYFLGIFIILIPSLLWPYHPFIKAVINSATTDWHFIFRMYLYDPKHIYKMGPALLGLPIILLLLIKKKYSFISSGFLLCLLIYVVTYFLNIRLGERYIFFMMFFLHLSLAWYFSTLGLFSFSKMKDTLSHMSEGNVHALFFGIIVVLSVSYQVMKLGFEQAGYTLDFEPNPVIRKYENPVDDYDLLKGKITDGDIVMSDTLTSWPIPALTGAMGPDNRSRIGDAIQFYNPQTPLNVRERILNKYEATHVLLNFDRMKERDVNRPSNLYLDFRIEERLMDDLRRMGEIVFRNDAFVLFKLKQIP